MKSNLPISVKNKMRNILLRNGWMTNWHEDNLVQISKYDRVQKANGKTELMGMDLDIAFNYYCKTNNLNPMTLLNDV